MTTQLSANILRAYDIRGIMGDTLSKEVAYAIGRGFASHVVRSSDKPHPVIVTARDGRASSPILSEALIAGMVASGAHVKDLGLGPSPMCYFGASQQNADAAIMLTGSHNPPTHNGFKMICAGKPFFGDDIQRLGALINAGNFVDFEGSIETLDIKSAYTNRMLESFNFDNVRDVKVVWDAGNGAAGEITEMLVKKLPGKHITLFTDIDGTFPNHHPDPTVPANLETLIARVKAEGADVGIAFDGDGDRIGAVDGEGAIIWGDQMMVLFAREILSRKPNATIIADVKASQTLFDDIAAHGGNALMWKTGHSFIKSKMKETGAELAGEMSGHIFFSDGYYGFDDGLYAAVRLLDIIAHSKESLTAMRKTIPAVLNTPEIRIDCADERKFDVVEEVRSRLKAQKDLDVNEVDGVRVKHKDGWWLCRASNTQAALIVRCEAQLPATLDALKAMVRDQVEQSGLHVDFDNPSMGH